MPDENDKVLTGDDVMAILSSMSRSTLSEPFTVIDESGERYAFAATLEEVEDDNDVCWPTLRLASDWHYVDDD